MHPELLGSLAKLRGAELAADAARRRAILRDRPASQPLSARFARVRTALGSAVVTLGHAIAGAP